VKITIGLSLSLTGEYAPMGRQAELAIRLFIADANASSALRVGGERCEFALECHDDASDPVRCAEIYRSLCADRRVGVIFGPYSNRLARVAAPIAEQSGRLFVNHGGAGDERWKPEMPVPGLVARILSSAGRAMSDTSGGWTGARCVRPRRAR